MTKWYIVQSKLGGKFFDGFYGWDSTIHSDEQIVPEDELPFLPDAPDIDNILVGEGDCKPCISHANRIAYDAYNRVKANLTNQ